MQRLAMQPALCTDTSRSLNLSELRGFTSKTDIRSILGQKPFFIGCVKMKWNDLESSSLIRTPDRNPAHFLYSTKV